MLVVTRKTNETIWIGKNIKIVVVSVGEGRVQIGIDAPRAIPVFREELLAKPAVREQFENAPLVAVASTGAA